MLSLSLIRAGVKLPQDYDFVEIISARAKKVELFIDNNFKSDDSVKVRGCSQSITDHLTL